MTISSSAIHGIKVVCSRTSKSLPTSHLFTQQHLLYEALFFPLDYSFLLDCKLHEGKNHVCFIQHYTSTSNSVDLLIERINEDIKAK